MKITSEEKEVEKLVKVKEKVITIELCERDAWALFALLGDQAICDWETAMNNSGHFAKLEQLFPVRGWSNLGHLEDIWNNLDDILVRNKR